MTTANTALRISELDFDTIRTNLKNYLRNQSQFSDYDFDGDGLSVLIDLLAYNTHYNAYYLNMIGNEMFLDTAQLRSSVLSHAKLTNYVPESRTGSKAFVNVIVEPNDSAQTMTMPRHSRFISEPVDGINYVFATTESLSTTLSGGVFTFSNVQLTQGETANIYYTVSGGTRRFTLPTANVDTDTITVTVQEAFDNPTTSTYALAEDITEIDANSKVFFVEENANDGFYTIYFGDNYLGKSPANNNIVIIKYLETAGVHANKANSFVSADSISNYTEVDVVSVVAASGGSERESTNDIRYRAPIHYSSQNRAVTVTDYEALLLKDYPNIKSVSVWSGEDNDPPVYGKVFISIRPKDFYEFSTTEKDAIIEDIIADRSVMTVFPTIIDPDYTYLLFNVYVDFRRSETSLSKAEIESLVRASIVDYADDHLGQFEADYRNSVMHRYIDSAHPSIISNQIETYVQKRIDLTTGATENYSVKFGIPLHKGGFQDALYTFPSVRVLDINSVERDIFFEEVPDSATGIDSIIVTDPGVNYTSVPTVTISGDGVVPATAEAKIVNGRLQSVVILNRGSGYSRATVAITGGGDGYGASAEARLEFRNGTLRTFYYKDNGEKVIVNAAAGTVDYQSGTITITNLYAISLATNDQYEQDVLTLNIKPQEDIIKQARNNILEIDFNDSAAIQLTVDPE